MYAHGTMVSPEIRDAETPKAELPKVWIVTHGAEHVASRKAWSGQTKAVKDIVSEYPEDCWIWKNAHSATGDAVFLNIQNRRNPEMSFSIHIHRVEVE